MGGQCNIAAGVVVLDVDGVPVVVDQHPVAAISVEAGEGGNILLEVLEKSSRGQIVCGITLDLRDQHLPS